MHAIRCGRQTAPPHASWDEKRGGVTHIVGVATHGPGACCILPPVSGCCPFSPSPPQTRGYFNRDTPVVGHLERPINYWKVYCKEEWNIVVNKKYKELQVRAQLLPEASGSASAKDLNCLGVPM